ncbi:AAA family ATPase [Cuneatibacter caecimuris]|nr:AAA family ATPase [Cuneatibacter caecimuris]
MLDSIIHGDQAIGDYYTTDNRDTVFFWISVPEDWRDNGVVEPDVYVYQALLQGSSITLSAYDANGKWLYGDMEHLRPLYKYLLIVCVMLANEMEQNSDYRDLMMSFIEQPAADLFVNLHEGLYQAHKFEDYGVEYTDLSGYETDEMISFSQSYITIKENTKEMNMIHEVAAERFEIQEFSPEYRGMIPDLGDEFVIPQALHSLCNAIVYGDVTSVLFHGPAGTGKTMSCKLAAQRIGLPILDTINCTENLDEYILGKFIPDEDRIVFRESYVTKAIRDGGAVVFEEINFAKPQYLAFLNSLLDDNGFVRLDNGEIVHRNKNFRFFATMNLGYFGTKELNQALYNRFQAVVEISELSDEAIMRMLTMRVPECKDKVDKVLGAYHKIKKKIESEELDVVISPRNLENWVRLAKYDGYLKAAEKTIIPIAKCDRVLENSIRGILRIYKWNPF